MTSTEADPVRIAVRTPDRQIDIALPADVPLSSVLPTLLRHGGNALGDLGAARGGWVLRRLDGTALDTGTTLPDQGVRDGDVLRLGFADESWPPLAYDDVVPIVAAASGRGPSWSAEARSSAGAWTCGLLGLLGVLAALPPAGAASGPATVTLGLAALVFAAVSVLAARKLSTPAVASALAALAAVYAGAAVLRAGPLSAPRAEIAALVVLSVGLGALAVLGLRAAAVVAGLAVAFLGAVAAGLAATWPLGVGATAAAVLSLAVLLSASVPVIAARLAGVAAPTAPRVPAHLVAPGLLPPLDGDQLYAAVARADALVLGLHAGVGVGVLAASVALAVGGPLGALLAGAAGIAVALRGRAYAGLAHRSTVYLSGLAGLVPALVYSALRAPTWTLPVAAVAVVVAGFTAASSGDSPLASRYADAVEIACTAAVVPLACAVTGLFGLVHHLA